MIKGKNLNDAREVISMEEYLTKRRMIRENESKEKRSNDNVDQSTWLMAKFYV